MNIDQLLSKHSDNYRFHGIRSATLTRLIAQSENGQIVLWGRDTEDEGEYLAGQGELSVTDISDVEMSYNEFCDEGGLVLVLEKLVTEPVEVRHETDRREKLVQAAEWQVIGGLRPIFDEDGDVIDQEVFSLDEIVEK
jgi:hypothetical protein